MVESGRQLKFGFAGVSTKIELHDCVIAMNFEC